MKNMKITIPPTETMWAVCPYCGAKCVIIDNKANCHGVFLKCTRGCKNTFELKVKDGTQIV